MSDQADVTADLAPAPTHSIMRVSVRDAFTEIGPRCVAEEHPVAITYNGSTYAVMMATPSDLDDFAIGFSLTEGIIPDLPAVSSLDVVSAGSGGTEVRLWLEAPATDRLAARRRRLAGPVGCGLCGLESIAEATRRPVRLGPNDSRVSIRDVVAAAGSLQAAQHLNRRTHALHAAALWRPGRGLVVLREDVGRHNALDKLVGAVVRAGHDTHDGIAVVTSRVSIDLVQKTRRLGTPILVAVSAPTALAVRAANDLGLTLVALARGCDFEVFTHPERILGVLN